jgi:hypothetical protein
MFAYPPLNELKCRPWFLVKGKGLAKDSTSLGHKLIKLSSHFSTCVIFTLKTYILGARYVAQFVVKWVPKTCALCSISSIVINK